MEKKQLIEEAVENFDPNGPGIKGQLFGLPFVPANSSLIIIPLPWEVTVSYHSGAVNGPAAILDASAQVDLCIKDIPNAWKAGISMLPIPDSLTGESTRLRELAAQHIRRMEEHGDVPVNDPLLMRINEACENLNIYVKSVTTKLLSEGKMVGLVGGDHSIPLGFIRALSQRYEKFGILQIDAHADLRKAYQGFTYSHASIMFNALKLPAVNRLVQIGIRDFCEEEMNVMDRARGRIVTFFDEDIKAEMYRGRTWDNICEKIVAALPENVYVSFDIDGLDPKLCPNTGTPVAGGFEFTQITHLLRRLARSGKKIIGFDLNEVAPSVNNDWDANVGARMLYQLSTLMAVTQGRLSLED
jgi:agmatinase